MKKSISWSSINWGKGLYLFVLLALVVILVPAVPLFSAPAPARVQPILARLAETNPDTLVGVIVQKTVKDSRVEDAVTRLGGTVTKDLSIINAFAAEMPAKNISELGNASGVKTISLDAPIVETGGPDGTVNTSSLRNAYNQAIGADRLWAEGYQGSSVTVAVIDSGMNSHNDIKNNIKVKVKANSYPVTTGDNFGHGTHVGGIIGGNGSNSSGNYIGVAPKAKVVSVKVTDDQGRALSSDLVAGMQWVLNNKTKYNIRIVNISLNSSTAENYNTSPVDAAAEILWFNGIVVVVSAGNNGSSGILYPPSNDPFVISVGAVDAKGTPTTTDDVLAAFSAFGKTESGFSKPDLVAPGKNIISTLASTGSVLSTAHPANRVSGKSTYFQMSGTSMSAPVVAGAVALLLQANPNLNPDQVKYRLISTARPFSAGNGAGYLDIYAAVKGTTTTRANINLLPSQLLSSGNNPPNCSTVDWGSVDWGSVDWGSVDWGSDYWGP